MKEIIGITTHRERLDVNAVICDVFFLPAILSGCAESADRVSAATLQSKTGPSENYVDMVDPYIMSARGRWFFFGTGKRPFGMVNLFPDTLNAGQGGGGYNYRFNEVVGFCHLHGWMTVGLDVMPTTNGNYELNKDGWKSPFSRKTEIVKPGYHKLYLDKYSMWAEITSTERVGFHRYTYPRGGRTDIIFSLGGPSGFAKMKNGHITRVSGNELEGYYGRIEFIRQLPRFHK